MRLILAVAVFAAFAAPASASFVVPSATYTGQVATGGTIKFKVSTDGNELTFIEVREAHTSCGIFSIPPGPAFPSIADDSFVGVFIVEPTGKMIVEGSFTAPRQAEGFVTYHTSHIISGACGTGKIPWTASASPLETTIQAGPKGKTNKRSAVFRFTSTAPDATFECKLDRWSWRACESPRAYRHLQESRHAFRVRATDHAGNVDSTPAKRSWRVD